MEAKGFVYVVVFQNSLDERVAHVYTGTFDRVFKKAKSLCSSSNYFIREIKVV